MFATKQLYQKKSHFGTLTKFPARFLFEQQLTFILKYISPFQPGVYQHVYLLHVHYKSKKHPPPSFHHRKRKPFGKSCSGGELALRWPCNNETRRTQRSLRCQAYLGWCEKPSATERLRTKYRLFFRWGKHMFNMVYIIIYL